MASIEPALSNPVGDMAGRQAWPNQLLIARAADSSTGVKGFFQNHEKSGFSVNAPDRRAIM
jgi:hypothetical protein